MLESSVMFTCTKKCLLYADECDAAVESAAKPSLLQEYVEAAYLLPQHIDPNSWSIQRNAEWPAKLRAKYETTGCLSFLHAATLSPHPLHTRLTSCACLLRVWAEEITDPEELSSLEFGGWFIHEGGLRDALNYLEAGLEVRLHELFACSLTKVVLTSMLATLCCRCCFSFLC